MIARSVQEGACKRGYGFRHSVFTNIQCATLGCCWRPNDVQEYQVSSKTDTVRNQPSKTVEVGP